MPLEPVEFGSGRSPSGCGVVFPTALILVGVGLLVVAFRTTLDLGVGLAPILVGGGLLWANGGVRGKPPQRLRLDADGLHLSSPLGGYAFDLAWSQVADVRQEILKGQSLVVLDARDPAPSFPDADAPARERRRRSIAGVGSGFVVPASLYGTTPEGLMAQIERFRRRYADAPPPVRREDMM